MIQPKCQNVFFADLHHPGGIQEEIEELFSQIPSDTARIFLLGDTFHYWINEYSFIHEIYAPFLSRLKKWADDGMQIFFLEGNRDFLARHYLEEQEWLDVLPNPSLINIAGRIAYIGHGDELCWNDWPYQMYKCFIRSRGMRLLADKLPGGLRKKVVKNMAAASIKIVAGKDESILKVPDKAYHHIIDCGMQMIIHGHLHKTYQKEIVTPKGNGTVFCFGWKEQKRNFIHLESCLPCV